MIREQGTGKYQQVPILGLMVAPPFSAIRPERQGSTFVVV